MFNGQYAQRPVQAPQEGPLVLQAVLQGDRAAVVLKQGEKMLASILAGAEGGIERHQFGPLSPKVEGLLRLIGMLMGTTEVSEQDAQTAHGSTLGDTAGPGGELGESGGF